MKTPPAAPRGVILKQTGRHPKDVIAFARNLGARVAVMPDDSTVVTRPFGGCIIRAVKPMSGAVIVTILEPEGPMIFSADCSELVGRSSAAVFYSVPYRRLNPKTGPEDTIEEEPVVAEKISVPDIAYRFESAGNVESGGSSLVRSPLMPNGIFVTQAETFYSIDPAGVFGTRNFTRCVAYCGSTKTITDGTISASTNDANFLSVTIAGDDLPGIFGIDGLDFNIGMCRLGPSPFIVMRSHELPTQAFIVKNADGKQTVMLTVNPVVETRLPPGDYKKKLNNESPYNSRAIVTEYMDRNSPRARFGIAVMAFDLTMTDEQKKDQAGNQQIKIGDRLVSKHLTQFHEFDGYDYVADSMSYELDPAVITENEPFQKNRILQLSSAVIESEGEEPATPVTLVTGERPHYYGSTKILTVSTHYGEYQEWDNETPPPPLVTCTTFATTYTFSDDRTLIDVSRDIIFSITASGIFTGYNQESTYYDSVQSDPIYMHYLYCSSGSCVPMVRIELDETALPEPIPEDDPPDPTENNMGQYVSGSATLIMVYPDAETVEYDLDGYYPPRPLMRGGNIIDHYSRYQCISYNTWQYGHETHTSTFRAGILSGLLDGANNGAYSTGYSSFVCEGPDKGMHLNVGSEDEQDDYYNGINFKTRRRVSTTDNVCIQQKIHGHIGKGKIAVLATNTPETGAKVSWSLVKCYESTGSRTADAPVVVFENLPLESACWISMTVLSPEEIDGDGNVITECVILVSLQRPTWFYRSTYDPFFWGQEQSALHQIQGRQNPRYVEETIQPESNINTHCEQKISRDGGKTWEILLNGMPGEGYRLGNALKSSNKTG